MKLNAQVCIDKGAQIQLSRCPEEKKDSKRKWKRRRRRRRNSTDLVSVAAGWKRMGVTR